MADVTLTVQDVDKSGLTSATYTAIDATDTYYFNNTSKVIVHFKNTGSEATITMVTPGTVSGQAIADPTVTVAATTGDEFVAFQPTSLFNDSSGQASFSNDIASGVTVAVLRITS